MCGGDCKDPMRHHFRGREFYIMGGYSPNPFLASENIATVGPNRTVRCFVWQAKFQGFFGTLIFLHQFLRFILHFFDSFVNMYF